MKKIILIGLLIVIKVATVQAGNFPVGTQFTYQGELIDGGSPANGSYDLLIRLYDSETGGAVIDFALFNDHQITNGLLNTELDFGDLPFNGDESYLEVLIRPGDSSGQYTSLLPRQRINVTPYAIQSAFVENSDSPWVDANGGINYIQDVFIGNANTVSESLLTVDTVGVGSPIRLKINGATRFIVDSNGGTSIGSNNAAPDRGVRVQGDTDLAGDLLQDVDNFGAIKAALTVSCTTSSSVDRSFNAVNGQAFTIDGSIALGSGACAIDFPFDIDQRFFVAMVKRQNDARLVSCNDLDSNTLICAASDTSGNLVNSVINILVY